MQALVTPGPTYNLRHIRKANIAWKSEIYACLQNLSARARAPKKLFSSLLVTFRLIRSLLDYQVGQIYGRK